MKDQSPTPWDAPFDFSGQVTYPNIYGWEKPKGIIMTSVSGHTFELLDDWGDCNL